MLFDDVRGRVAAGPDTGAAAGWLPRSGWAEPAARAGCTTIAGPTSVRLLSPPHPDEPCGVEAAAGAIPLGACFAVRFYAGAARRVILACRSLAPAPGGAEIAACVLVDETAAPEREHARHTVDVRVRGRLVQSDTIPAGTILDVHVVNVSASGAMIAAPAEFGHGDVVALDLPDGPAELEVFRRDARAGRWGARFRDAARGRSALGTLLGLARG